MKKFHVIVKIVDQNGRDFFTWVDIEYSRSITMQKVEQDAIAEINSNNSLNKCNISVYGIMAIDHMELGECKYLPLPPNW